MMDTNRELRFANQVRLRELKRAHGNEVAVFCSDDARELAALQRAALQRDGLSGLQTLATGVVANGGPIQATA